ncbi:MAG: rhodanese-related sulfurtransferase [Gammaproteobacteria bacterium]|nr:rhodanese-related sulfurtransferase [Gammaproteobacteria bacterium]
MVDSKAKQNESNNVVVLALYKFVHLPDYIELKTPLLEYCKKLNLFGTILLAEEGINGTIAGDRSGIDNLLIYLEQDIRFTAMECKESAADEIPFHRMKVKLKKEIVSMGVATIVPEELTGTRVKPEDWNTVISDPEVLLIDTRNQYEVDIGTFKNALSPETETFRDFPEYVDSKLDPEKQKRVAMFCTGGIRCEKASAYLLEKGFEEVYQLDGGILKYLEDIEQADSLWEGECFVFDGRVAVNHELAPGIYAQCYACRRPVSPEQMNSNKYEEGVSCPHCYHSLTASKRAAVTERQKQVKLAEKRNQTHIGASFENKI